MSTVGFIQGDKQWMIFHLGFDKLQSIIFTAVVNDYQAGFAFFVVTFYDRVPVPDGLFYISDSLYAGITINNEDIMELLCRCIY